MLKKSNSDILIGMLVASLFWVGVFVWQSSQPPNHTSAASQHCEGTKSECAKATTDERIADYTWWLAVLTAGLVCSGVVQFGFLIRSDNTARIAATAADLSARAAISIELPIIRAAPHHFSYGSSMDGEPHNLRIDWCIVTYLNFANGGRTKALPIEVRCGWTSGDKLPDVPAYTHTKSFPVNSILDPTDDEPERININDFDFTFPPGHYEGVLNRTVSLWFYCSIVYLDFMQIRHEAGFCWKRHELFGGGKFLPDATSAYNRKT